MSDIVKRLRAAGSWNPSGTHPYESLIDDAADEIERLRAALERIMDQDNSYGFVCHDIAREALEQDNG